jgi:hypothetical protein
MKLFEKTCVLAGSTLLFIGLSASLCAQPQDEKRDRTNEQTAVTGCLNKDASTYVLTDETSGVKMAVTGTADLEKHSANHKVKLTGSLKQGPDGKAVLDVSKIDHIADSCSAPK